MTETKRISGVLSPVVTPFKADLSPDPERFVRQCRWLLSQNVGLAVFGTNSEANSLSIDERIDLLDRLVGAGIDPARMEFTDAVTRSAATGQAIDVAGL